MIVCENMFIDIRYRYGFETLTMRTMGTGVEAQYEKGYRNKNSEEKINERLHGVNAVYALFCFGLQRRPEFVCRVFSAENVTKTRQTRPSLNTRASAVIRGRSAGACDSRTRP